MFNSCVRFFEIVNESHVEKLIATIVNPSDIYPICFVFLSGDFRYLIVHHKNQGGRRMLTAYSLIWVSRLVESGFSFTLFPQAGQNMSVASIGAVQKGQRGWFVVMGFIC